MEANESRTRWTYSEFARLPSGGSTRYEVIDGELAVTPAPTLRHQRIALDLGTMLHAFVRRRGLGHVFASPVDVLFAEGDYIEPDLVFVHQDRAGILTDRGIEGPPDLVVEILSPSTAARDRGVKLERYRRYGVPEYWIVDPGGRAVDVWRLGQGASTAERFGPGATLVWAPAPDREVLEIEVDEIFEGMEELPGG